MPGTDEPQVETNPDDELSIADQSAAILRAKNIKEFKSTITLAGTLCFPNGKAIESGVCVNFKNKGLFDGKWIVQKVTMHITDNKFNTEIEFRKCYIPVAGTTITTVLRPGAGDNTDPDPDPEPGDAGDPSGPTNPTPPDINKDL